MVSRDAANRDAAISCLVPGATEPVGERAPAIATIPPGRVLETLAAAAGSIRRVLLPDTAGSDEGSPPIKPWSCEMSPPSDRTARVPMLGEIARGGGLLNWIVTGFG